jgi:Na+/proline symporter
MILKVGNFCVRLLFLFRDDISAFFYSVLTSCGISSKIRDLLFSDLANSLFSARFQMDFYELQKQPLFLENLLFFVALLLSFLMQLDLLVKCMHGRINDRLSANLLINLTFWVLTCFAGLPNIGYVLVSVAAERNG